MRRRAAAARAPRLAALLVALLLAAAPAAHAHVPIARASLRQWVAGVPLVVVARFESDVETWTTPDGRDRQDRFRVRVLETLVGTSPGERLAFFPHAEGLPRYRAGDRALLFLERSAERPEFAHLARWLPWYSMQGAGHEWRLAGPDGEAIAAAARRWAALRGFAGDLRPPLRAALLAQLESGVERLRRDALVELMVARSLPGLLDAETTAALGAWARERALAPGQRLALVRLLEGAPGFDANAALRALTREALPPRVQVQLVRIAATRDDPALRAWAAAASAAAAPRPPAS